MSTQTMTSGQMRRDPSRRLASRTALGRQLLRFRRDEDGSMIIFAMFLMIMMLIVGGMAVDMMRFESTRARLQATLDRAILAASDLEQNRDAEDVVRDYFAKAGLLDQITSITVTEAINSKEVTATAAMDVDTMFMSLVGIESLLAPATGTAIENVSDIEIMLVLDVSGSMQNNGKIGNLRDAANEFVASILANDIEQRISIGIVPFNGQVNLGPVLLARYNIIDQTGVTNSNCVDLPPAAYAQLGLATTLAMPQTAHADTFSGTDRSNAFRTVANNLPRATNIWCPLIPGNIVRLPTSSIAALQLHISGLTAVGATSINAGMRWGSALLDPGSRPLFTNLIAANQIPSYLETRPYDYNRNNTLKVVVLMTDGEHFAEERVNPGFRSGISPIWRATTDTNFSIFHESWVTRTNAAAIAASRPFWVPHLSQWQSRPWNGTSPNTSMPYAEGALRRFDVSGDGVCNNTDDGLGVLQATQGCWGSSNEQTWPEVWAAVRMHWVAWQLYGRPLSTTAGGRTAIADAQMNLFRAYTPTSAMDTQLANLCAMVRAEEVVVFGIAFEAPPNGQTAISSCASSPSHYFNAQGLQISAAFRAIASQINSLRLIQ